MAAAAASLAYKWLSSDLATGSDVTYFVLAESIWHSSTISTNFNVDSAKFGEEFCDRLLKNLVCTSGGKAKKVSNGRCE